VKACLASFTNPIIVWEKLRLVLGDIILWTMPTPWSSLLVVHDTMYAYNISACFFYVGLLYGIY